MANILDLCRRTSVYDLDNYTQKREAASVIYYVASRTTGRLADALMVAELPYDWTPKLDGRTAEAKELEAANRAMFEAIVRYDNARLAAVAKAKTK